MGWVLAQLRDKKMTQAQLAAKVGIHISTLSKYENLGRIPEEVFLRMCEALEQPPDLVIEATLKLVRRDLRKALRGKAGEPAEAAPPGPGEPRPSLARLRELYDSYAAEQKKWLFAVLQYLGGDLQAPLDELSDILPPAPRKKRKPSAKAKKKGEE
ncbi:MAG: helix-turn-helix domain-containing protein [Acidobacteria bacterium]|nr:helix-turn-helix domain-containing protein [Acidobacteriota bacterium]